MKNFDLATGVQSTQLETKTNQAQETTRKIWWVRMLSKKQALTLLLPVLTWWCLVTTPTTPERPVDQLTISDPFSDIVLWDMIESLQAHNIAVTTISRLRNTDVLTEKNHNEVYNTLLSVTKGQSFVFRWFAKLWIANHVNYKTVLKKIKTLEHAGYFARTMELGIVNKENYEQRLNESNQMTTTQYEELLTNVFNWNVTKSNYDNFIAKYIK